MKTALVTGGATGIGSATAHWLARDGMNIVVGDINLEGAQKTVASIMAETSVQAIAVQTDLGDIAQVEALVAAVTDRFETLDAVVNSAADLSLLPRDLNIVETDFAVFDRTYEVNYRGIVAVCKFAIPHMIKSGGGAIVNVASVAGLQGDMERSAYGSQKAAVIQLSRAIAIQFGKQNIRCNAVCPGLILNDDASIHPPEEVKDIFRKTVATAELGVSSNAAELIGFLATPRSQYVTGEQIAVDGGYTKRPPTYFSLAGRSY